jgi:hypothetical protein
MGNRGPGRPNINEKKWKFPEIGTEMKSERKTTTVVKLFSRYESS